MSNQVVQHPRIDKDSDLKHLVNVAVDRHAQSQSLEDLIPAILKFAKDLYEPESKMPYHNANHAFRDVLNNVLKLAKDLQACGEKVNLPKLILGAIGHDIDNHLAPGDLGFKNSEALASTLIMCELIINGAAIEDAVSVGATILCTHHSEKLNTIEDKILRAADLAGLKAPYEQFVQNSETLFKECQIQKNPNVTWAQFLSGQYRVLGEYLVPLISLTKDALDADGRSVFHMRALANMLRFLKERLPDERIIIKAELGATDIDTNQIASLKNSRTILLVANPKEEIRAAMQRKLVSACPDKKNLPFCIPGTAEHASIPDKVCDEVTLSHVSAQTLTEAYRILKNDGHLIINDAIKHAGEIPFNCKEYKFRFQGSRHHSNAGQPCKTVSVYRKHS